VTKFLSGKYCQDARVVPVPVAYCQGLFPKQQLVKFAGAAQSRGLTRTTT
jgi:hypothetical protein